MEIPVGSSLNVNSIRTQLLAKVAADQQELVLPVLLYNQMFLCSDIYAVLAGVLCYVPWYLYSLVLYVCNTVYYSVILKWYFTENALKRQQPKKYSSYLVIMTPMTYLCFLFLVMLLEVTVLIALGHTCMHRYIHTCVAISDCLVLGVSRNSTWYSDSSEYLVLCNSETWTK